MDPTYLKILPIGSLDVRWAFMTQDEVILLRSTLVQIWQSHIERFYGEDNDPPPNDPDVGVSSDNPEPPKNANGHSPLSCVQSRWNRCVLQEVWKTCDESRSHQVEDHW